MEQIVLVWWKRQCSPGVTSLPLSQFSSGPWEKERLGTKKLLGVLKDQEAGTELWCKCWLLVLGNLKTKTRWFYPRAFQANRTNNCFQWKKEVVLSLLGVKVETTRSLTRATVHSNFQVLKAGNNSASVQYMIPTVLLCNIWFPGWWPSHRSQTAKS